MLHHQNGQTTTASIQIPNISSSSKQIINNNNISNDVAGIGIAGGTNDYLKVVKSYSNNSYSEQQRLASSITNYLYSSLSPPSPTTYKVFIIFNFYFRIFY